jgi:hypothetical protein
MQVADYLKKAEELEAQAKHVGDPRLKAEYLALAKVWRFAAHDSLATEVTRETVDGISATNPMPPAILKPSSSGRNEAN